MKPHEQAKPLLQGTLEQRFCLFVWLVKEIVQSAESKEQEKRLAN